MENSSFALDRLQAERLLYEGLSTPRFTQDTPVMPDVWIAFAQAPRTPLSLLITPIQNGQGELVSPGKLSKVIGDRLTRARSARGWRGGRGGRGGWREKLPAEVVYNRTAVNAVFWFDEVVRVLLPLTEWWHSRIVGQPEASPLRRLNDSAPGVRQDSRDLVVEALKRADRHVREMSQEKANAGARQRARLAFGNAAPEAPANDAAAILDYQVARSRAYHERFRRVAELATAPNGAQSQTDWVERLVGQPDILWMIRVVGTLGGLFWERPELSSTAILGDWRQETDRKQHLVMLEAYYRHAVDTAADLLLDIEGTDTPGQSAGKEVEPRRIHCVSTCRKATTSISMSRATVNADAAVHLFDIDCRGIAWAVVDSGIDATHPAFLSREDGTSRVVATFDFTLFRDLLREGSKSERQRKLDKPGLKELFDRVDPAMATDLRLALQSGRELDWPTLMPFVRIPHTEDRSCPPLQEHGTHVAGIIGADCPDAPGELYRGLCPEIRLFDFRVLDDDGEGDEFNVMAALQLIRYLNANRDVPAIHGVNLSLSIAHDVANFACGRTPICNECERLVNSGLVVVVAAGNEGYLEFLTGKGPRDSYRNISITDPGNADSVITVGATHRFQPHNYGVSYFSSRGPTGDGRSKPDLVAPGEKIHSTVPGGGYKPMDGTSMAAPHVSGAAALLLARHRELIGQPGRVKSILCASATDLGRERYFQGAGMVDVLRALQSI